MLEVVNETIYVELSRDKMLGVIWFMPPGENGRKLSLEEIKEAINQKGIVKGINEEALIELSQDKKYNYKYVIAQGVPAVHGEDGELFLNFDRERLIHFVPKQKENGTVDFKDLGTVFNVKKGDVLATRTLATMGQNGYNVLGGEVRAKKGKQVRLPKGKNTECLDDLTLISSVDGKLEYDGYNVYINTVYTVNGDVDSSTGNIKFVGNVVVRGSVLSGFTVEAAGSVEVQGPVEDAIIIAGKDIFLSYGIQGTEKSKIIAGGNIVTKFIQNAHVEAKGDIITEAIIHSTVTAGNDIKVDMGKGTIVGGSITAANMIIAKSIGSSMGTVSDVQIGVLPELYQEHKELANKLQDKQEELAKLEQSIMFLNNKFKEGTLDANRRIMFSKLKLSRQPIMEQVEQLKHEFEHLSDKLRDVQNGVIKSKDAIYPGVKITLGNMVKYIDDPKRGCTIRKIDGELSIG